MYEKSPVLEVFASLTLAAGSIGGVSLIETAKLEPVRATEVSRMPSVYIRRDDMPKLDTDGEPYGPPAGGPLPGRTGTVRSYPVRRNYGRSGQLANRVRGDISSINRR